MTQVLVTPAELQAMTGPGVVAIDTRSPDAHAAGHIPGAVKVHDIFTFLATSTPEGMATLRQTFADAFGAAALSGAETAVCHEGSMNIGFGQSCRGYFLLSWLGYAKAKILHGGLQAWTAAGLPSVTEVTKPQAKPFPLPDAGSGMMVDSKEMPDANSNDLIIKLDVRDADEWIGTSSSPYGPDFSPRKGRIPGAEWLERYRLMKPTASGPMFKAADEIMAEAYTVGISANRPVYPYCFKGARVQHPCCIA